MVGALDMLAGLALVVDECHTAGGRTRDGLRCTSLLVLLVLATRCVRESVVMFGARLVPLLALVVVALVSSHDGDESRRAVCVWGAILVVTVVRLDSMATTDSAPKGTADAAADAAPDPPARASVATAAFPGGALVLVGTRAVKRALSSGHRVRNFEVSGAVSLGMTSTATVTSVAFAGCTVAGCGVLVVLSADSSRRRVRAELCGGLVWLGTAAAVGTLRATVAAASAVGSAGTLFDETQACAGDRDHCWVATASRLFWFSDHSAVPLWACVLLVFYAVVELERAASADCEAARAEAKGGGAETLETLETPATTSPEAAHDDAERQSRRRRHYEAETFEDTFVVAALLAVVVVYVAVGGTTRVGARAVSALVLRVVSAQAAYLVGEVTALTLYVASFVLLHVVDETGATHTLPAWLSCAAATVALALLVYAALASTMFVLYDGSHFGRLEYVAPVFWCAFSGLESTLAVVTLAASSAYDGRLVSFTESEAVDTVASSLVGVVVATVLRSRRFELHGFTRAASALFFVLPPAVVFVAFCVAHGADGVGTVTTPESMLVSLGAAGVGTLALVSLAVAP